MQIESFWQKLEKPILGLSPMDGLTDHAFRHIQKKYSKPAVVYTEFTSVEGICHNAEQLLKDFMYDETQRPIVAQVYGTTPAFFRQTAVLLCMLGFDGIDINMGCPAKNVAHSGAGAALINTPELAQTIVRETKAGVADWCNGMTARDCPDISERIAVEIERRHAALPAEYQARRPLPVSVKTRIGFDAPVPERWIAQLLEVEPAVIALHGRTLKQQYGGLASWEEIAKAAELIHTTDTLILGNGDIANYDDALARVATYGVDGVLIGRASLGNPFVFQSVRPSEPSIYRIALEHCTLFEETYKDLEKFSFLPMRKHLSWYITSIPNAAEIRTKLVLSQSAEEVEGILKQYNLLED